MKYFALLVLIIAVTSKRYVPAQKSNDALDVLKCFAQKGVPLAYEYYVRITELINEKKYLEIIPVIQELIGNAKEVIQVCLEKKILAINWKNFGQCILNNGGRDIPELAMLVVYIASQNWIMVATTAATLLTKGIGIVVKCYNQSK